MHVSMWVYVCACAFVRACACMCVCMYVCGSMSVAVYLHVVGLKTCCRLPTSWFLVVLLLQSVFSMADACSVANNTPLASDRVVETKSGQGGSCNPILCMRRHKVVAASMPSCVLALGMWVHAANLLMVSLGIHHKGLIHCGIANGSSLNLSCVVKTRLCSIELALQANKRVTHAYISCSKRRTKGQRVLRTMLLSFTHLSSPGQNFYASKILISFSVSCGQVRGPGVN